MVGEMLILREGDKMNRHNNNVLQGGEKRINRVMKKRHDFFFLVQSEILQARVWRGLLGMAIVMSFLQMAAPNSMAANFVDNGDHTVTDIDNGLMWQKNDDDIVRTWREGLSHCEGLSLAGYSDWKLPDIRELISITDDTKYSPAADMALLPKVLMSPYWSATTYVYDASNAWAVDFDHGSVIYNAKADGASVRCVR